MSIIRVAPMSTYYILWNGASCMVCMILANITMYRLSPTNITFSLYTPLLMIAVKHVKLNVNIRENVSTTRKTHDDKTMLTIVLYQIQSSRVWSGSIPG